MLFHFSYFFLGGGGGGSYKLFMTVAVAVPPLTVKNRHVRLFGHVRLIGRIWYLLSIKQRNTLPVSFTDQ